MTDSRRPSERGEDPGTTSTDEPSSTARLTPGMRRVLWGVGGIALIALAVAAWFAVAGTGGAPSSDATPTASATPGPLPGATPTSGSEVQTPATTRPEDDRIPDRDPLGPLAPAPLPDSGTRSGGLVDGYPSDVMAPVDDSEVLSSAIATEGSAMQVTLVARTDAGAGDVGAHYRSLWSGLGLVEQASTDPDVITFTGRQTTVTLAFSPDSATGTVYNVLGSFRTE